MRRHLLKIASYSWMGLLTMLTLILVHIPYAHAQSPRQDMEGDVNVEILMHELRVAIGDQHIGIEVQLHGKCTASEPELIAVGPINWQEPKAGGDRLSMLQRALRENKQLAVTQTTPNVIIVRDSKVSQDLLATKIKSLDLTKLQQYSPDAAIARVLSTEEVQLALQGLNMRMVSSVPGLQHVNQTGEAHLDHHPRDTSVDAFLKAVLAKFGGVIVYVECIDPQGQRKFDIQYYK